MSGDRRIALQPIGFGIVGVASLCTGSDTESGQRCCRVADHDGPCIDADRLQAELKTERWAYLPRLS